MSLFIELLAATGLIILVTVIHGTGVALMDDLFKYEARALRKEKLAKREIKVMVPMALCLFTLHSLEIMVFAGFYLADGDEHSLRDALYHSALAYTTMGGDRGRHNPMANGRSARRVGRLPADRLVRGRFRQGHGQDPAWPGLMPEADSEGRSSAGSLAQVLAAPGRRRYSPDDR